MRIPLALVAALLVVVPALGIQPRNVELPVNPRYSLEKWAEILNNQTPKEEVCLGCRPGTKPQHPSAGYVPEIGTEVVNGRRAKSGQFPYQVGMTIDSAYFCGGSVISENWVLTAGHCVVNFHTFSLVFGSLKPYGDFRAVKRLSTNGVLHPEYYTDSKVMFNDIALVGLSDPISFTKFIKPIKLATDVEENLIGQVATVSGWGMTADYGSAPSSVLNYVGLEVIDNAKGAAAFGESVNEKTITVDGSQRKSGCEGDSGGPLVVATGSNQVKQVGIVSFGSSYGCSKGYPSVYTRVASHIKWLENATGIKF